MSMTRSCGSLPAGNGSRRAPTYAVSPAHPHLTFSGPTLRRSTRIAPLLAITATSLLVAGCSATGSGAPDGAKDAAVADDTTASPRLTVRSADDGKGSDAPSAVARPGGGHDG